jgi:hypothetical protein
MRSPLPALLDQQKQILCAKKSITLASIMSTIRAEWHRRNMEQSAAANFAKTTKTDTNTVKTCKMLLEDAAMAEAGAKSNNTTVEHQEVDVITSI